MSAKFGQNMVFIGDIFGIRKKFPEYILSYVKFYAESNGAQHNVPRGFPIDLFPIFKNSDPQKIAGYFYSFFPSACSRNLQAVSTYGHVPGYKVNGGNSISTRNLLPGSTFIMRDCQKLSIMTEYGL